MTVREAVYETIRYYRYRGITVEAIDQVAGFRVRVDDFPARRSAALVDLERENQVEQRGKRWYLSSVAFKQARGDSYRPEFEKTDFHVLFALVTLDDECDLVRLIGAFDFIIRVIPCFDEMYLALNRLYSARLITRRRGRFVATQRARDLHAVAESRARRNMYDQLDALKRLVLCPCCGAGLKRVTWRVKLTKAEYDAAVKQYGSS